jgi:hypothetical protein
LYRSQKSLPRSIVEVSSVLLGRTVFVSAIEI